MQSSTQRKTQRSALLNITNASHHEESAADAPINTDTASASSPTPTTALPTTPTTAPTTTPTTTPTATPTQQHQEALSTPTSRLRSVSFSTAPPHVTEISPHGAQASTRAYREGLRQKVQHAKIAAKYPATNIYAASTAGFTKNNQAPLPPTLSAFKRQVATSTQGVNTSSSAMVPTTAAPDGTRGRASSQFSVATNIVTSTLTLKESTHATSATVRRPIMTDVSLPPIQAQPPSATITTYPPHRSSRIANARSTIINDVPLPLKFVSVASPLSHVKHRPLPIKPAAMQTESKLSTPPSTMNTSQDFEVSQHSAPTPARSTFAKEFGRRPQSTTATLTKSSSTITTTTVTTTTNSSSQSLAQAAVPRRLRVQPQPRFSRPPRNPNAAFNLTDLQAIIAQGDVRPEDCLLSDTIFEALAITGLDDRADSGTIGGDNMMVDATQPSSHRVGTAVFTNMVRRNEMPLAAAEHSFALPDQIVNMIDEVVDEVDESATMTKTDGHRRGAISSGRGIAKRRAASASGAYTPPCFLTQL